MIGDILVLRVCVHRLLWHPARGPPVESTFQAPLLAMMPKSQVDITMGKLASVVYEMVFAIAEFDSAASEAPAADILMNLRRLYILLIYKKQQK
jgi:hypothetical protein